MMHDAEYIIVGSGCSAAMAAQTLVEAGKQVLMVDVGEANPAYSSSVPDSDYLTLRKTDKDQYKYLLGEKAEGVTVDGTGKGAQVTPPRSNMLRNTEKYIPMQSDTFSPLESLGYGGLGIGWGLQCWQFTEDELEEVGLDKSRMIDAYEVVAKRIGVSGVNDEAGPYTLGKLKTYSPAVEADRNMRQIQSNYRKRKHYFEARGVFMGRTPLALLTHERENRRAYAYRDMDFYDDNGLSAWRPWVTVDQLRKAKNFTYIDGFLALSYSESNNAVTIHGIHTKTNKKKSYKGQKLILATGALGTARIVLRSVDNDEPKRLPFLCNPYTYVPCIQPKFFGAGPESRKIGFGQVSVFLGEEKDQPDTSILTLYSYQSLMLFRVIRQAPLNFRDARKLFQYLSSGLVVTGIQHSDRATSQKYLELVQDNSSYTGDKIVATYKLSDEEIKDQKRRETIYIKALRRVGLFALKRMNPGHGSSVHYAGTLPYSDKEQPLTLSSSGRMHGTKRVYVADSAGFKFLPARGLTFTILANAHLTAENALYDKA